MAAASGVHLARADDPQGNAPAIRKNLGGDRAWHLLHIAGWDEGIVGQTVGSQVLLVVPPYKGYGTTGTSDGSIKGTDTLVFVVDILDAS